MKSRNTLLLLSLLLMPIFAAHAEGEAVNGFPNWSERVLLEWINRARVDPQTDLAGCSSAACSDKACYTAQPPRGWNANIAHAGRFHSDELSRDGFFDHYSECVLVPNIASLYLSQPQGCNGTHTCACTGGVRNLGQNAGTDPFARMALFSGGVGSAGEIIAGSGEPDDAFYNLLYESTASATCSFHSTGDNGHRWLILTSQYGAASAGPGVSGSITTVDFDDSTSTNAKIPSGTHYPQQAANVDAWVNWHDSAAPSAHAINVDGTCSNMSLTRGSPTNGAWHTVVGNVGSGCHRYFFAFKDSHGADVRYPTTGSLAIGNGSAQCADWLASAPAVCADVIFASNFGG